MVSAAATIAFAISVTGQDAVGIRSRPPAIAEDESRASEPEVQTLRERLTEREDETRLEDPLTIELFGRPLVLSGQYEIALETLSHRALGERPGRSSELLLDQEIELEAFILSTGRFPFMRKSDRAGKKISAPAIPTSSWSGESSGCMRARSAARVLAWSLAG